MCTYIENLYAIFLRFVSGFISLFCNYIKDSFNNTSTHTYQISVVLKLAYVSSLFILFFYEFMFIYSYRPNSSFFSNVS